MYLFFLAVSASFADLAPEPLECPQGSYSARMGRAQWCQELTCTTDDDCVGKGSTNLFQKSSANLKC